jgi:UDPglucose 6-dehydrogenase
MGRLQCMNIVICGTGYVGLTTGSALAFLGHNVVCVDIDESKVEALRAGIVPIYEPGLPELITLANSHLQFSTEIEPVLPHADVVFLAVGTPSTANGQPDLSAVYAAATAIGQNLGSGYTVVVNKSTVPIGSGNWVESIITDAYTGPDARAAFTVASNPEFLREGSAIADILYPDRVVFGTQDERAAEVLYTLYRPILEQSFTAPAFLPRPPSLNAVPLLGTDLASAELIKYASNAFLSLKVSFINEIGTLAECVGADITQIARGIGLDSRIGSRFLQSGLGWGGSCFGKDSAALIATGQEYGLSMPIVEAARAVNYGQREAVVRKLLAELKILKGRTIGILGLAFKPDTDDLRDAPALDVASFLLDRGARVKAHDPVALENAKAKCSDSGMQFCDTAEEVILNSDAVVLATDWPEYRNLPWKALGKECGGTVLLDARNFLDPERLVNAGFRYIGMGRQPVEWRRVTARGYVA